MLVSRLTEEDYRERETTANPLSREDYDLVFDTLKAMNVEAQIQKVLGNLGEKASDFSEDAIKIPRLINKIINPINNSIYKAKGWVGEYGHVLKADFFMQPPHLVRALLSQNYRNEVLRYFQKATVPFDGVPYEIIPKQLSFLKEEHLRQSVHHVRDFAYFMLWEKFDATLRYESSTGNLARFRHLRANYDIEEKNMREALLKDFPHRIYSVLGRDLEDMWRHYFVFVEPGDKLAFHDACYNKKDTSLLPDCCTLLGSYDAVMYRRERRRSMGNQINAMVQRYSQFVDIDSTRNKLIQNRHSMTARRNPYGFKLKTTDWTQLYSKNLTQNPPAKFNGSEDITEHYAKTRGTIEPLDSSDPETLLTDLLSLRVSLLRAAKNSYKGNISAFGQPYVIEKEFSKFLHDLSAEHALGVRELSHIFRNIVDDAYIWRLEKIADFLAGFIKSFEHRAYGWQLFKTLLFDGGLGEMRDVQKGFNCLAVQSRNPTQFHKWNNDDWYAAFIGTLTLRVLMELRGLTEGDFDYDKGDFNYGSILRWLKALHGSAKRYSGKRNGGRELEDLLQDPCIRHPSKIRQCIFAIRHSRQTKTPLKDVIIDFSTNNGIKKIGVLNTLFRYFIDEEDYSQNVESLRELLKRSLQPAFDRCKTTTADQFELLESLTHRLLGPDPHNEAGNSEYWQNQVAISRTQDLKIVDRLKLPTKEEIEHRGKDWAHRPDKSWAYTVAQFIIDTYGPNGYDVLRHDGTGLRKNDLRNIDRPLYNQLNNWLRKPKNTLPEDCPLPTKSEAIELEAKLTGIENREALKALRDLSNERLKY